MELQVTPIGVNDAFTTTGFNTNYLLETEGARLLLDCGSSCAKALAALDINLIQIEDVYISHLHLDHAGGLIELGIKRYINNLSRPNVYIHRDLYPIIWDCFLSGPMSAYIDRDGQTRTATAETFFNFICINETTETSESPFIIENFAVRPVPVEHIVGMSSHGLVVNDKVFLTTDTTYKPDLLESVANRFGIEAIFHDCSFTEANRQVHTCINDLKGLPKDLKDLLILTHYEDHITSEQAGSLDLGIAGKSYRYGSHS